MMEILPANSASVEIAAKHLAKGEILALPTETVYGLAGDATNGTAISRIYQVKNRPQFNPLIVHVDSIEMVEEFAIIDDLSRALMDKFWPGPLTLVLPLKAHHNLHPLALAGLDSVALRCPHGIFRDVIGALKRPLVAPSANKSGRVSPTNVGAVGEDLGADIAYSIDGGACKIGIESTIIKVSAAGILLLRPGGLAIGEIARFTEQKIIRPDHGQKVLAPGMLLSHYAPNAPMRLDAKEVRAGEGVLAFGNQPLAFRERAVKILNLSPSGNSFEAAEHLFDYIKQLDKYAPCAIAVQPIAMEGLGEAINDRLKRAAAPRD